MVKVLLSAQESNGESGSDEYDGTAHHLVNGGCALSQSHEHEGGGRAVEGSWDGKPEWVDASLQLCLLGKPCSG